MTFLAIFFGMFLYAIVMFWMRVNLNLHIATGGLRVYFYYLFAYIKSYENNPYKQCT